MSDSANARLTYVTVVHTVCFKFLDQIILLPLISQLSLRELQLVRNTNTNMSYYMHKPLVASGENWAR